ncbi:MAG TPA: response regulator [Usitatibacter sp.]|nr:response regulator [Usitatibacter sp.]
MTPALLRKANVLAVDDQRANLVALDAVLGSDNNMIFAHSGPEAIEILAKRQDVDVILMDLQMPVMDGFETASRIKRMEGCEEIPVVFITAVYNEDPYIKQGYKVGAVDYFSKPFDPEVLKVKVGIYASFRQRADFLRERERKVRAADELRAVAQKLWDTLDTLHVGVIMTDRTGKVCRLNTEVHALCKSAQAPGDFTIESLGWWDATGRLIDGELEALASALSEGKSHNEVLAVNCVNGTSKTVLCSASPLHEMGGGACGAVFVFQDLTNRKALEHDLADQIAKLASTPAFELHR